MSTAALDPKIRKSLQGLADSHEFRLTDLARLYLAHYPGRDLKEITENGMPVIEEIELLAMKEEGGDGKIYSSAEELMKDLND